MFVFWHIIWDVKWFENRSKREMLGKGTVGENEKRGRSSAKIMSRQN